MTHDGEYHEEAEYEVVTRRRGRVQLEISVPGVKSPIQHGMKVGDIKGHPDGEQAAIEERVARIAAQNRPDEAELDLPDKGRAKFDPRTRDGKPKDMPEEAER